MPEHARLNANSIGADAAPSASVEGSPEASTMPVQVRTRSGRPGTGRINRSVYMAAYEVYSHVYGPQIAMITGGCRGGFSAGEIIAFLYARPFPKDEWYDRVQEAFHAANLEPG